MNHQHIYFPLLKRVISAIAILTYGTLLAMPDERPNIIFILADDVGYQSLSCNGSMLYRTPVIDGLADDGIQFTQCHAMTMCAPSRSQLMTGKLLFRSRGNDARQVTFAQLMRQAGYSTCISGKWLIGAMDPYRRGFDEACIFVNGYRFWDPHIVVYNSNGLFSELNQPDNEVLPRGDQSWPVRGEGWVLSRADGKTEAIQTNDDPYQATCLEGEFSTKVATDFLLDFVERHSEGPFMAYLPIKLAHVPYVPTPHSKNYSAEDRMQEVQKNMLPGEYLSHFIQRMKAQGKPTDSVTGNKDYTDDMVSYMDYSVGRIVDKLEDLEIRDNTLLIFSSDNGTALVERVHEGIRLLPGGKAEATEGGTRVPLIINWPDGTPRNTRCDDLVDFTDFLPTFADIANVEIPKDQIIDGRSFFPQIKGQMGNPRNWVYLHESVNVPEWERLSKDSHIKYAYGKSREELLKTYIQRWVRGKRYKLYADGRFYDLKNDLNEKYPIAPGRASATAESERCILQQVLDRYANRSEWSYSTDKVDPSFDYDWLN